MLTPGGVPSDDNRIEITPLRFDGATPALDGHRFLHEFAPDSARFWICYNVRLNQLSIASMAAFTCSG